MNNDATKVYSLLDELDNLINESNTIPLSGKILVSEQDIKDIIREIRVSLPEDMQQASWIKDNAEKIANEAKYEYERLINEAKEEATYLTNEHEITIKAKQLAHKILDDADKKSKLMILNACDSSDKVLYDLLGQVDEINVRYFEQMLTEVENTLTAINDKIYQNREKLKEYATEIQTKDNIEVEK